MVKIREKLVVAVTVALLAFPISSALAETSSNPDTQVVVATTTTTTTVPVTTLQEAAEAAVAAYEAAPITTLLEVATAEGLKEAADTAVAAVVDEDKNAAFELRVTNQAAIIETAKTALTALVVDEDGDEITSATWFSDLINRLQLALTYDPVRKGELNKQQALRKLAQAHKLMANGNSEASQLCLHEYTDKITKAQEFLLEVEDTDSETAKTLAKALVNVESNNIQVLGNLVDKLPPQAAQKLALNVVRTMEKAVVRIQKEEAKVAIPETPAVTPAAITVSTSAAERKIMEKQAKVALEQFKRSINEKGKIHIEDLDEDEDEDEDQDQDQDDQDKNVVKQSKPEHKKLQIDQNSDRVNQSKTTQVTIVPVKTQTAPTFRTSEKDKDDRNQQEDSKKDKDGDKRQDHK
jgi:hypothetical protein